MSDAIKQALGYHIDPGLHLLTADPPVGVAAPASADPSLDPPPHDPTNDRPDNGVPPRVGLRQYQSYPDTDEADEQRDAQKDRRYREWQIGQSGRPAMERLIARVLLTHASADLSRPGLVSRARLAAETSLSPERVRRLARRAEELAASWYDDQRTAGLRLLWAYSRRLRRRWWGMNRSRLCPAERLVVRLRWPDLPLSEEALDHDDDDWFGNAVMRAEKTMAPRFHWIRAVRDAPAFERQSLQRKRRSYARSPMACVKSIAFSVDLLVDANGRPYRQTTLAELGSLAGYRDSKAVAGALRALENAGFLVVMRLRGRRGGLLPICTAPDYVRERWEKEEVRRFRHHPPECEHPKEED